jgi:hypothetical protein
VVIKQEGEKVIKEVELLGIDVFFKEKIVKSYQKIVKVIKDNQELYAQLDYEDWDGYSISWYDENYKAIEEPIWVSEYAKANSYHDLAYLLDEMGQQ